MEKYQVPSEIVKCLDSLIMGQTDEKQKLAVGLYNHCISVDSNAKTVYQKYRPNNLFIVGPDGLGKEQLFSTITAVLNVPYAIYDCKDIEDFDAGEIIELLQESASLLCGSEDEYDYDEDFEIPTCVVFLDNIDRTDQSFSPNLKDLVAELKDKFKNYGLNTKAQNLLFVCVISPSDAELNGFEKHRNDLKIHLDLFNRRNIRKMIEKTHSCVYLTTRDTDLVARNRAINDIIIRYRQLFAIHKAKLEFSDEATAHMNGMQTNELNNTLNHIFSLAMLKIPGSNTNVVQVTLDTLTERKCPNLIERKM